jgi:hypothetical protein
MWGTGAPALQYIATQGVAIMNSVISLVQQKLQ